MASIKWEIYMRVRAHAQAYFERFSTFGSLLILLYGVIAIQTNTKNLLTNKIYINSCCIIPTI